MESICLEKLEGISGQELAALVTEALREREPLKKVLIIPPDLTRAHSRAGSITRICWDYLKDHAQVHILPALGTHMPMNEAELRAMFGPDIPKEAFLPHNWRRDVITLGEVPAELIEEYSEGKLHFPIEVQLNRHILDSSYDLILSLGQVVPHEVVGMANHSKNLFVGCGGESMINRSHFLGAVYGMERMMGRDHSPVRKVFDYAAQQYLKDLPLTYILTVVGQQQGHTALQGVYIGEGREPFNRAVALSQKQNLDLLDEPLKKVVVFLDPEEFRSTWLGNKAVYRTRLAIADGGELLVIAPGVCRF